MCLMALTQCFSHRVQILYCAFHCMSVQYDKHIYIYIYIRNIYDKHIYDESILEGDEYIDDA